MTTKKEEDGKMGWKLKWKDGTVPE